MNRKQVIEAKMLPKDALLRQVHVWRFLGKKIIFTNGCFDVLHPGHFHLLNTAATLEEHAMLVVGLNEDISVRQLKGANRPIHTFELRAMALASLSAVDAVIGFDTATPLHLIEAIRPDVLVKGGDYTIDNIVGADIVLQNCGRVEVLPFLDGHSTTSLLNRELNK
jgi:rfaE bifunctional protein nucleotidyltransferase chain/domain